MRAFLAAIAEPRRTPAVEPGDATAAPREVRGAVVEVGRSGTKKIVATEVTKAPFVNSPALNPTENLGLAGDPKQDQLAATIKSIREAEDRSAAPRHIMGDTIRPRQNLDAIKKEWNLLDAAGRREFNIWKRFNGDPDYDDTKITDVES